MARRRTAAIIGAGPVGNFASPPKVVADASRRSLRRRSGLTNSSTQCRSRAGDGFTRANVDSGFACYSFAPRANLPLKIIVLDNTQKDEDPNPAFSATSSPGYGHGSLDKARFDWLVKELDDGEANGQLMIVAAHVPIGVEPANSYFGWSSAAYVSRAQTVRQAARIFKSHPVDHRASPLELRNRVQVARSGPSRARILAGRDLLAARLSPAVPYV